jgi:hypothetical protein
MTQDRLREIAARYAHLRIAINGDFCLDRYLEIDSARAETSIETGLPVYNVARVRAQPGAAGTILNNLVALGVGEIFTVGFCGEDGEGYELLRALRCQCDPFPPNPGASHLHLLQAPHHHPRRPSAGTQPARLEELDANPAGCLRASHRRAGKAAP